MSELKQRQDFHGETDTATQSERVGRYIIANTTLGTLDKVVIVSANTATGNIAVTLANVSESAGSIVSIRAVLANAATVTIKQPKGAPVADIAPATGTVNLFYSDGVSWTKIN